MGKNKGIWIAIAVIVLLGAGVTLFTNRFVSKNESSSLTAAAQEAVSEETPVTEAGAGQAMSAPVPRMRSALTGQEAAGGVPDAAPASGAEAEAAQADSGVAVMAEAEEGVAVYDGAAEDSASKEQSSEVLSPLAPASSKLKVTLEPAEKKDMKQYYEKHLTELDAQIQKMRAESSDSTTYSMQALADKELKLWNLELNSVYSSIAEVLTEDAKSALEQSQQTWMKERDSKAQDAAKKYSGGSLEGVEYAASLAESTRQRTYDLVDEYVSVLSSGDGQ